MFKDLLFTGGLVIYMCVCACVVEKTRVCEQIDEDRKLLIGSNGSGLAEADTGRKAQTMKPPAVRPNFQNSHRQHSEFIC